MTSYRMLFAPPQDEPIRPLVANWKEDFTKDRLLWHLKGDEGRMKAILREKPRLLEGAYWAHAQRVETWDGDGVTFNLFGHRLRLTRTELGGGKWREEASLAHFRPQVFMKPTDEGLFAYLMGRAGHLPPAKTRVSMRITDKKRAFKPITFKPKELYDLVMSDLLRPDGFTLRAAPDGDGKDEIMLRGQGIGGSPHLKDFPPEQLTQIRYESRFLTPRGRENDPTILNIKASTGAIASRQAGPSGLHEFALERLTGVLRKNRHGNILPPVDDEDEETEEEE